MLYVCFFGKQVNANEGAEHFLTAIDQGNVPLVTAVIATNPYIANTVNDFGATPLMRAANNGNIDIIKLLLRSGANVNAADAGGATALHIAARRGNVSAVQILLDSNSNPNAVDSEGWTPLMRAATSGNSKIIELLLAKGAKVNATNEWGESAAVYAAKRGDGTSLSILKNSGANLEIRDINGNSAIQIAQKKDLKIFDTTTNQSTKSSVQVHIAAFESDEEADAIALRTKEIWRKLVSDFPASERYDFVVSSVQIDGTKSSIHRIRIHGFESEDEAENFCKMLRFNGRQCFIVTELMQKYEGAGSNIASSSNNTAIAESSPPPPPQPLAEQVATQVITQPVPKQVVIQPDVNASVDVAEAVRVPLSTNIANTDGNIQNSKLPEVANPDNKQTVTPTTNPKGYGISIAYFKEKNIAFNYINALRANNPKALDKLIINSIVSEQIGDVEHFKMISRKDLTESLAEKICKAVRQDNLICVVE